MILFFDTETTGLPLNWKAPITDFGNWPRLVQLAYQLFDDNGNKEIEGEYLVKPNGYTIPLAATKIHKITHEKAFSQGINISYVLNEFKILMDEADTVVAHNLDFDEKIVGCEFLRLKLSNPFMNKHKICTMKSSTNFCAINGPYGYKWPSLSELHYKLFNTYFEEAHNAMIDIQATSRCFWELVNRGIIKVKKSSTNSGTKVENEDQNTNIPFLIPYRKKDKWGFCTPDKKIVIDCEFESVNKFSEGFASVKRKGYWGFIDIKGNFVIQPKYLMARSFKDEIAAVQEKAYDNSWSFINTKGISIFSKFEYLDDFNEGMAPIGISKFEFGKVIRKYGFIDKTGSIKIPIIFDYDFDYEPKLWLEKLQGQMNEPNPCLRFSENRICLKKNDKYGFFDKNGEIIVPFIYDEADKFSNGLAEVGIFSEDNHSDIKSGYVDMNGELTIPLKYQYKGTMGTQFSEYLALVFSKKYRYNSGYDKMFFINQEDEVVISDYGLLTGFSEGLAVIEKKEKYGFINKNGDIVIECKYDDFGYNTTKFSDGLCLVYIDNHSFYINKFGEKTIKCKEGISYRKFKEGLSYCSIHPDGEISIFSGETKYGYMDKNGVEFWED